MCIRDSQHTGSANSVICPGCAAQGRPTHRYCAGCGLRLVPPTGWTEPAVRTQRRTVTVLFVDMVGFTRLASRLTPEAVRQVQLRYFHAVRSVIHRHHGVVEKYIGDAVMAVFGAGDRSAAAYRAVRAATELPRAVRDAEFPVGVQAQVRVGVATGVAAVDVAGAVDGAVGFLTGDVINIAARLQAHAAPGTVAIGCVANRRASSLEAAAGGGVLYEVLRAATGGPAGGYAGVFFLQGFGLIGCIPLLRRIDPDRFQKEAAEAAASWRLPITG